MRAEPRTNHPGGAVAADSGREGQEMSRRIRDELERIRDAEGRVEDALESVRQARRRVEVIARDLSREELRVRALVRDELRAATGAGTISEAALPPAAELPEVESPRAWRSDPGVGWARRPVEPEVEALPLPEPIRVNAPVLAPPSLGATRDSDVPLPSSRPAEPSLMERRSKLIGIGVAALIAVMLVGWLAIRGFQRDPTPDPAATVVEQEAPPPAPEPVVGPPAQPGEAAPEPAVPATESVLATLPAEAAGRTALYDSLWTARSPLFEPLVAKVESDSDDRAVERAVAAWRDGSVDVQEGDLLHSAFVQAALNLRAGRQLELDGQLLRNPCRGGSCTALLDLWRSQRERYGLPEVPSDATTNTTALRQAEVALVLDWMKEATLSSP
jgi:hypothetical protein